MMLAGLSCTAAEAARQLAWSALPVAEVSQQLAWSALPTAPVVADRRRSTRAGYRLRAVAARALRRAASALEPPPLPLATH